MSIVDVERLRRFMSSPEWTNDQKLAALDVLDGVESTLESALHGAPISPRPPVTEPCPISETGQVITDYPVFEVSAIDGTPVVLRAPGTTVEPVWSADGWRLDPDTRRVYTTTNYGGTIDLGTLITMSAQTAHVRSIGQVTMTYRRGWGDVAALRLAILRKAATMMRDKHDDTLVTRGTDATRPPADPPEEWTDAELRPLGIYRSLTAWR